MTQHAQFELLLERKQSVLCAHVTVAISWLRSVKPATRVTCREHLGASRLAVRQGQPLVVLQLAPVPFLLETRTLRSAHFYDLEFLLADLIF